MKFEGRDSEGEFAAASLDLDEDKFVALILPVFYMRKVDSRRLDASQRRDERPRPSSSLAASLAVGRGRPALHWKSPWAGTASNFHGKLRAMRSSTSSAQLRQEALPMVCAA